MHQNMLPRQGLNSNTKRNIEPKSVVVNAKAGTYLRRLRWLCSLGVSLVSTTGTQETSLSVGFWGFCMLQPADTQGSVGYGT